MGKVIIINWRYLGENRSINDPEKLHCDSFKHHDVRFVLCDYRGGEENLLMQYIKLSPHCDDYRVLMLHENNNICKDYFMYKDKQFDDIIIFSGSKDLNNLYYYGDYGLIPESVKNLETGFETGTDHIKKRLDNERIQEIWEYLTIDIKLRGLKKNLLELITPIAIKLEAVNDVVDSKTKKALLENANITEDAIAPIKAKLAEYLTVKNKKIDNQNGISGQTIGDFLDDIQKSEKNESFIKKYCNSQGDSSLSKILKDL